jgi:predicted acylesterase/phospholipase RssA/CRP-like cAMP-binding protein
MRNELETQCISPGDLIATLASSPLFANVDPSILDELEPRLDWVTLVGGEVLFEQGGPGDCVYLGAHGRLRATVDDPREPGGRVVGEIGRGEIVGEMALLTGAPRSATVRAVRDTVLIRMSREAFDRLLEDHPAPMLGVVRLIVERYQRTLHTRPAAAGPATFAVVAGADDVGLSRFAGSLVEALAAHGTAARLSRQDYERFRGAREAASSGPEALEREVAEWLHGQEAKLDRVVYEADPGEPDWTRICLRQADAVLVVAQTGARPRSGLRDLLTTLDEHFRPRRELVLLYDASHEAPSGTAEWLSHMEFDAHHHVDPHVSADYERLGRMLTGTAVGLVLGGGGARGFAHIGVLRALQEKDIPVDLIGGTSMGAFIGAQCACDWDWQTMVERNRRAFLGSGSLNDYTLPLMAVLAGRRFYRLLRGMFGDQQIEDLRRPYYCVAANLSRSDVVVHRTGPLHRWVATSMAVPGVVPPAFHRGEVLVDGGVLNTLPSDVMRRAGRGPVLAVSVSAANVTVDRDYPDCLSPWKVLWSRINPFTEPIRVPGLRTILARSATLQRPPRDVAEAPDIDLLFEPPVAGFRLLDWSALETLVEIGYRSALERLEQKGTDQKRGQKRGQIYFRRTVSAPAQAPPRK